MSTFNRYVFVIHHLAKASANQVTLLTETLKLLNINIMTGRNVGAVPLSAAMRTGIENARVVVAILTRDVRTGYKRWQPSQWVIQEVTWAIAHDVPCLLAVEEGVVFDRALVGDLEQIRFAPGHFTQVMVQIVKHVQALVLRGAAIPRVLPEANLSDKVRLLIMQAREHAANDRWQEVLNCANEALGIDSTAWRAALTKGVAFAQLGRLRDAEQVFQAMLDDFSTKDDSILARVWYNLAWVEEERDAGSLSADSLQKQVAHLERSLSLDRRAPYTRALLILCKVATKDLDEATRLLADSLKVGGFIDALRHIVETKGSVGHLLMNELPNWLYPQVFPQSRLSKPYDDDNADDDYGPVHNDDAELDRPEKHLKESKMKVHSLSRIITAAMLILLIALTAFGKEGAGLLG